MRSIHELGTRGAARARRRALRLAVALAVTAALAGCASSGAQVSAAMPGGLAATATGSPTPRPTPSASPAAAPATTPAAGPTPTSTPAPTSVAPAHTPAPNAGPVSIGWVGDTSFGKPGSHPTTPGQIFATVPAPALHADVMLANLETALGDDIPMTKCATGQQNCYAFEAPTSAAAALKAAGFAGVNVANNHTMDAGSAGVTATDAALTAAGLVYAGRPGQITYFQRGGATIALLGFAPYYFDDDALDLAAAQAQVREASAHADIVIVMDHLGGEGDGMQHVRPGEETYLGEDRGDPIAFSHAVIDAGADLVIGSGPHVLRGMEWYRGRLIAYSLGNFANFHNLTITPTSSVTAALHVTLRPDGSFVSGDVVPLRLVTPGSPQPDPSGAAVDVIRSLSQSDFGPAAVTLSATGAVAPPQ
ncbi:MAG: CapA family protein [Microbacteriaceae bacterium]|nr:CapA family protein [Microbacteriaceae bacterium]MCL2794779.1 CapA family protein [Microbacteriaceae bacterium]